LSVVRLVYYFSCVQITDFIVRQTVDGTFQCFNSRS